MLGKRELPLDYFDVHLGLLFVEEGRLAHKQFIGNRAEGPPIDLEGVALL